jgi:hypothetical protein
MFGSDFSHPEGSTLAGGYLLYDIFKIRHVGRNLIGGHDVGSDTIPGPCQCASSTVALLQGKLQLLQRNKKSSKHGLEKKK